MGAHTSAFVDSRARARVSGFGDEMRTPPPFAAIASSISISLLCMVCTGGGACWQLLVALCRSAPPLCQGAVRCGRLPVQRQNSDGERGANNLGTGVEGAGL